MRAFRLNLEDLDVSTFEPVAEPVDPSQPLFVEWTGCMSDCSGCGRFCPDQTIGTGAY